MVTPGPGRIPQPCLIVMLGDKVGQALLRAIPAGRIAASAATGQYPENALNLVNATGADRR